jgi:hypothetical protein
MMMNDMTAKLKGMDMKIFKRFLVYFIMTSLFVQFDLFKTNYNTQKEKWKMSELIVMYVEEEEMSKAKKLDFAHVIIDAPKSKKTKDNSKDKNKVDTIFDINKVSTSDTKYTPKCHHCKKHWHVRKDCKKFKDWLVKKGNDFNFMIYESLFVDIPLNTWWIDTRVFVHITNLLLGFLSVKMLQKGERKLKIANGLEAEVETVGTLRLILKSDFILDLYDVVYFLVLLGI